MPSVNDRLENQQQPVEWVVGDPYKKHVEMGRPNKLTQAVGNMILDSLRKGVSVKHAAGLAGVSEGTVRGWRDLGEADPDGPYGDFSRAFKAAQGLQVEYDMQNIRNGADKWQANAWTLERLHPEDYGLKKDSAPPTYFQFVEARGFPDDTTLPEGSEDE